MIQVLYLLAGLLVILLVVEMVSRRRSRRVRERNVFRVPDPDSDAEIVVLVRARRKIEAIKKYREQYRVDLRTARRAIEAIERRIQESD